MPTEHEVQDGAPADEYVPAVHVILSPVRPAHEEPAGHMTPAAESDEAGQ